MPNCRTWFTISTLCDVNVLSEEMQHLFSGVSSKRGDVCCGIQLTFWEAVISDKGDYRCFDSLASLGNLRTLESFDFVHFSACFHVAQSTLLIGILAVLVTEASFSILQSVSPQR